MSFKKDFSQQFPSPERRDFSQQFPSPEHNEVYHTPPEHIFPVFSPPHEPVNNPPENEPVNNLPVVDQDPNPFGLSEEQLRQMEQDMEVFLEFEQREREEEAASLEQQAREDEERRKNWESGWFPPDSESSEDGYPDSDDTFR